MQGEQVPFKDGREPTKLVLHFGRVCPAWWYATSSIKAWRHHLHHTFIITNPLELYYLRQEGRGSRRSDNGIGPIYITPPFVQRGYGIGSFLSGLFRTVRPILRSSAKSLGREAIHAGGNILKDTADNPAVRTRDIISKHVTELAQNIIKKLCGGCCKRERAPAIKNKKQGKVKRAKTTKRDIFS